MKVGLSSNLKQTGALANWKALRHYKSTEGSDGASWMILTKVTVCPSTSGKFFRPVQRWSSMKPSVKILSQSTDTSGTLGKYMPRGSYRPPFFEGGNFVALRVKKFGRMPRHDWVIVLIFCLASRQVNEIGIKYCLVERVAGGVALGSDSLDAVEAQGRIQHIFNPNRHTLSTPCVYDGQERCWDRPCIKLL